MTAPKRTPELLKQLDEFIFGGEAFRSKPYLDTNGTATIGIGCTIYPDNTIVKMTDPPCTLEQANEWKKYHLENRVFKYVDKLCKNCPVEVPESVYIALCSIAYNGGAGWLKKPSFINPIKKANWGTWEGNVIPLNGRLDYRTTKATGLCHTFSLYDKENIEGQMLFSQGLHNRRVAEIKFMLKGLK